LADEQGHRSFRNTVGHPMEIPHLMKKNAQMNKNLTYSSKLKSLRRRDQREGKFERSLRTIWSFELHRWALTPRIMWR
jgi:hypothetical protein